MQLIIYTLCNVFLCCCSAARSFPFFSSCPLERAAIRQAAVKNILLASAAASVAAAVGQDFTHIAASQTVNVFFFPNCVCFAGGGGGRSWTLCSVSCTFDALIAVLRSTVASLNVSYVPDFGLAAA